jgi:AraC-like DNA-binding protein
VFHISVAQGAWLLGYEGPTSFNHAFGRWTGRTASDARRRPALKNAVRRPSWVERHKVESQVGSGNPRVYSKSRAINRSFDVSLT